MTIIVWHGLNISTKAHYFIVVNLQNLLNLIVGYLQRFFPLFCDSLHIIVGGVFSQILKKRFSSNPQITLDRGVSCY